MPIELGCVNCDETMRVGNEQAGKTITCRKCGQVMRVPRPESRPLPLPPPLPEPRPRKRREEPKRNADRETRDVSRSAIYPVRQFDHEEERSNWECPPLPKDAPQEALELGRPVEFIDTSTDYKGFGLALMVVGGGIAGSCLLAALANPTVGLSGAGIGAGILAIGVMTYIFTNVKHTWICQDGFVWLNGKKYTYAPWREVRLFQPKTTTYVNEDLAVMVFNGGPLRWDVSECVIGFKNGKRRELTGKELIEFLTRRLLREVVPMYLERIENGREVTIAPFKLTDEGLSVGKKEVAWSDVLVVDVRKNEIQVRARKHGMFAEVELGACSMASVFVPLALKLAQKQRPSTAEASDPFDFD